MRDAYPLVVHDLREYPEGFDGDVFVWDVDKTYLSTRFSSVRGLARIPVEFAVDKRAIPGMPEILRGLRRGPGPRYRGHPIYFVTASPPQLRDVLERKMLLDGVEHDGITFKDWARCLLELRPWRLREQVGFKVCALLASRLRRPRSREHLFGDDAERDADAYHLYARLLSRDLSAGSAEAEMQRAGVHAEDRRCVHALLDRLGRDRGQVERAYIHLERGSPPQAWSRLAPLVVPVRGAVQLALALFEQGHLDAGAATRAVQAASATLTRRDLDPLVRDAVARGLVSPDAVRTLGGLHRSFSDRDRPMTSTALSKRG